MYNYHQPVSLLFSLLDRMSLNKNVFCINRCFYLNSFGQGVKIEVKQVDDNYEWLYNENQYLVLGSKHTGVFLFMCVC